VLPVDMGLHNTPLGTEPLPIRAIG
jgi:hypothetical protein